MRIFRVDISYKNNKDQSSCLKNCSNISIVYLYYNLYMSVCHQRVNYNTNRMLRKCLCSIKIKIYYFMRKYVFLRL